MDELNKKVRNATKWSIAAEIAAKIISPLSNMILARILAPEAFGVVATVTMITSFADMFTDAGFQKYLVQHEFEDKNDKNNSTTVAFWTNLLISFFLWIMIIMAKDWLAELVGNPGLGNVIAIACVSLPLTSFSSIQMALFRREFDFKTLFMVRIVAASIPIVVTIPLALFTRSYWALIIGTIVVNFSNAVILTLRSPWKPSFYFDRQKLKEMFSFSCWTLLEQISIWLTSYADTFIVGVLLTPHYLGIYKTSMTTVNQITTLITSATTPVLFSTLSRTQNDEQLFKDMFFKFQRNVSIFILPLGTGIFLYRELVTDILLGNQWKEAANFIGLWGLTSTLTIIFSHFSSEVYRAKGKPRLSFLVQCSQLFVLIPVLILSSGQGFQALYTARSLIRLELIVINMIVMGILFKITPLKQIKNILPEAIATLAMSLFALGLKQISNAIVWQLLSIILCIFFYFMCLIIFPNTRAEILQIISPITYRIKKRLSLKI